MGGDPRLLPVYCHQLIEWGYWDAKGCCGSCHSEWADGVSDPLEREVAGVEFRACCALLDQFDYAAHLEAVRERAARHYSD